MAGSKPRASVLSPLRRAATEAVAGPEILPVAGEGATEGTEANSDAGTVVLGSSVLMKEAKGEGAGAGGVVWGVGFAVAKGDSGAEVKSEGMGVGWAGVEKGEAASGIKPKGETGGLEGVGAAVEMSKNGVGGRELAGGCEGSRRGGRMVETMGAGAESAIEEDGGAGCKRLWKGDAGADGVEGGALNREPKGLGGASVACGAEGGMAPEIRAGSLAAGRRTMRVSSGATGIWKIPGQTR